MYFYVKYWFQNFRAHVCLQEEGCEEKLSTTSMGRFIVRRIFWWVTCTSMVTDLIPHLLTTVSWWPDTPVAWSSEESWMCAAILQLSLQIKASNRIFFYLICIKSITQTLLVGTKCKISSYFWWFVLHALRIWWKSFILQFCFIRKLFNSCFAPLCRWRFDDAANLLPLPHVSWDQTSLPCHPRGVSLVGWGWWSRQMADSCQGWGKAAHHHLHLVAVLLLFQALHVIRSWPKEGLCSADGPLNYLLGSGWGERSLFTRHGCFILTRRRRVMFLFIKLEGLMEEQSSPRVRVQQHPL